MTKEVFESTLRKIEYMGPAEINDLRRRLGASLVKWGYKSELYAALDRRQKQLEARQEAMAVASEVEHE